MIRSKVLEMIKTELDSANNKYPAFHSTHEGYAVLREEIDELWDEIKVSKSTNANRLMVNEAVQVAAMAIKFIENLYQNVSDLKFIEMKIYKTTRKELE